MLESHFRSWSGWVRECEGDWICEWGPGGFVVGAAAVVDDVVVLGIELRHARQVLYH